MNERERAYILLTTLDTSTTFLLISNEISKKKRCSVKQAAARPSNLVCATEILIGIFFTNTKDKKINQIKTMHLLVMSKQSRSRIFCQHVLPISIHKTLHLVLRGVLELFLHYYQHVLQLYYLLPTLRQ